MSIEFFRTYLTCADLINSGIDGKAAKTTTTTTIKTTPVHVTRERLNEINPNAKKTTPLEMNNAIED